MCILSQSAISPKNPLPHKKLTEFVRTIDRRQTLLLCYSFFSFTHTRINILFVTLLTPKSPGERRVVLELLDTTRDWRSWGYNKEEHVATSSQGQEKHCHRVF